MVDQAMQSSFAPTNTPVKTLILGVGNYLMGDEGVGVHLAEQLSAEDLPEWAEVLDGGTGGFHLMGAMEQCPRIVIVDATLDGRPAGTIQLRRPRFSSDFPRAMSTHDIGLRDVLDGLSITGKMPDVYLYTISISDLQDLEIALSPPVESAMHEVKEEIKRLISKS